MERHWAGWELRDAGAEGGNTKYKDGRDEHQERACRYFVFSNERVGDEKLEDEEEPCAQPQIQLRRSSVNSNITIRGDLRDLIEYTGKVRNPEFRGWRRRGSVNSNITIRGDLRDLIEYTGKFRNPEFRGWRRRGSVESVKFQISTFGNTIAEPSSFQKEARRENEKSEEEDREAQEKTVEAWKLNSQSTPSAEVKLDQFNAQNNVNQNWSYVDQKDNVVDFAADKRAKARILINSNEEFEGPSHQHGAFVKRREGRIFRAIEPPRKSDHIPQAVARNSKEVVQMMPEEKAKKTRASTDENATSVAADEPKGEVETTETSEGPTTNRIRSLQWGGVAQSDDSETWVYVLLLLIVLLVFSIHS